MGVPYSSRYTVGVWNLLPLLTLTGWAQEPAAPTFVDGVQPAYPTDELAQGRSAAVLLELELDERGEVAGARVVESAGDAFDQAALQAARSFRFTPTVVDGQAIPVTIGYRVVFEPERAPTISVEGELIESGTRQPLGSSPLRLTQGDRSLVVQTQPDGSFRVAGLADGTWTLTADGSGLRMDPVTVEVVEGRVARAKLYAVVDRPWERDDDEVSENIVVEATRVTPEITERVLTTEEARYLPGTNGDIVRVVQNLPGVARPPLNIGQLLIRGTSPEDSRYYVDGAEIPLVFHFAGLSTVVNGDAIEEIAFLPGNYGVRYGRTLGGAVDLRIDSVLPERTRGYVSVDLFQTTAFVEAKLGRKAALTISGRRSYVDAILTPVLSGLGAATVQAPRYYDLQARFLAKTRNGSFDALFLLSDDRFRVVGPDEDDKEEVQIGLSTTFQKLRLLSREELGKGWRNEASFIVGPEQQSFEFANDGRALEGSVTGSLRNEIFRAPGGGILGLRAGIDVQVGQSRFDYDVPGFGEREEAREIRIAPAAYLEPTLEIGPVRVVPGIRVDGLRLGDLYTAWTADPRIAMTVGDGTTRFKGSTGLYSQWPTMRQAVQQPDLIAARAWQSAVGIEQQLGPDVSLEVNAYTNQLSRLVSGREDAFRFFSGPPPVGPLDTDPYANDGVGSIYGVEALFKLQTERTVAWVAATLSQSSRIERPDEDRSLFAYDQPVVLTALASHQLPRRWRVGMRARYGSGNPYTPVVNRFQTFDRRGFAPVYGKLDSARLPAFWQLDVRVDKDWVFKNWQLTAYLDLQNATNAQNVEVISWTYDFSEEDPITQIPVVPAFGVRGEW